MKALKDYLKALYFKVIKGQPRSKIPEKGQISTLIKNSEILCQNEPLETSSNKEYFLRL